MGFLFVCFCFALLGKVLIIIIIFFVCLDSLLRGFAKVIKHGRVGLVTAMLANLMPT